MMSADEWSNAFDLNWNNIASNQAPGLSRYEKSHYLTIAQNELVRNWYNASSKGNNTGDGFDGSAIRQMDFSSLVVTMAETALEDTPHVDPRALVFDMPGKDEAIAIINEQVGLAEEAITKVQEAEQLRQVVPVSYQEYVRLMSKPFKEPLKWQAWRLLGNTKAEIVLSSPDKDGYKGKLYIVRYLKKPYPIILEALDGLTIEGKSEPQNPVCELGEPAHEAILQRAVELAKVSWEGDVSQTQLSITTGQRSD